MNPVIQRLQNQFEQKFVAVTPAVKGRSTWVFDENLKHLDHAFYGHIAVNHLALNLEYTLIRQRLHANLSDHAKFKNPELKKQLIEALMLNEMLAHVFTHYLDVPREVRRLQAERKTLQNLLSQRGIVFAETTLKEVDVGMSFAHRLREEHLNSNWYRLLTNRSIRLLDVIAMMSKHATTFLNFVWIIDNYLRPIMPYIASVFFLPRLFMNLTMLFKHTVPGSWMSEEEKLIAMHERFKLEFSRRWFEVCNDIAWAIAGVLNCFVLVGALAPYGVYLSISFFTYDVVLASIRAYRELSLLGQLREEYHAMAFNEPFDWEIIQYTTYIQEIDRRVKFDQLRLGLNVGSTISVVLAVSCALPAFASTPVIPLLGALWLVSICFINLVLNRILDDARPKDDLTVKPKVMIKREPSQAKINKTSNMFTFFHTHENHLLDHVEYTEEDRHSTEILMFGSGE